MEKHHVGSETGQLRSVMLHRPNLSLKRLTSSDCQGSSFDDVLSVERVGEECDIFVSTLRQQGIEVLLLTDSLTQTLDIPRTKSWLLEAQVSDYRLSPTLATGVHTRLVEMSHRDLARYLSDRPAYSEIPVSIKSMVVDTHDINDLIMKPLPNHSFTCDTSCWIYSGVSINPMAKPARQHETNNLCATYCWHPQFADDEFIKYFGDENTNYDHIILEGGDVLMIGWGAVLTGVSERTMSQGAEFLVQALLKHRQAERVIAVELPKYRFCIYLDTVMIHIDIDIFSAYPEVVRSNVNCWMLAPDGHGGLKRTQESTLLHATKKALGIDQARLITMRGDAFEAEREQWNDTNNVLTLRPGVVVGYECNIWTNEKYDKADITVPSIPGDELGRRRNGVRCMSCPLHRDGI